MTPGGTIFTILIPFIIILLIITMLFFILSKTSMDEFKSCKSQCEKGECEGRCEQIISDWKKNDGVWWYIDPEEISTMWYVLSVIFGIITAILFMPFMVFKDWTP